MSSTTVTDVSTHAKDESLVAEDEILTVDDLVRARAADKDQIPLIYFPRSERAVTDFDGFNGKDIDRMVDHVAKRYMKTGVKPVCFPAELVAVWIKT